jgi:hypothetical protein
MTRLWKVYQMRAYVCATIISLSVASPVLADEVVSTWGENDCFQSEMTATKNTKGVLLNYSLKDICSGQTLATGDGTVPSAAWAGSVSSGKITFNLNVADVPGYPYAGQPQTFGLIFTRNSDWYKIKTIEEITDGPNIQGYKTTQKIRGFSAETSSWNTLVEVPGFGSMTVIGAVNKVPY